MKLTLRSLFLTVRRERMVFFLLVLCIASSAIVIHFAYGLYQNYHIILEEGESAAKELRVRIVKPENVTKKALHDCLVSVSDETNGDVIMYLAHPVIEPFQSKQTDWGTMTVRFTVVGAMIAPCEIYASNITQNGALFSGRYFDTQQEATGSRTALAGPVGHEDSCTEAITSRIENGVRYITVQGKEYEVIGTQKMYGCPVVPFMSLDDNTRFSGEILIGFRNVMKRSQYEELRDRLTEAFGEGVHVPELDIPETSERYLYRTILLICAAITLLAAANFSILYQYLLSQRKRQIAVFRICGCTRGKAVRMFYAECCLLMVPVYLLSVLLFAFGVCPQFSGLYPYMAGAFSLRIYLTIFLIYFVISTIVLMLLIRREIGGLHTVREGAAHD